MIQVGQIYHVKPQSKQKCWGFIGIQGHKIKIHPATNATNKLVYEIFNVQGEKVGNCNSCFSESDLVLKKDFNSLDFGDQVELNGFKRTVLSILPSKPENMVYVLSESRNQRHANYFASAQDLIDEGWKIVGEQNEEVKELTVAEVSEKLGYQVKIIK